MKKFVLGCIVLSAALAGCGGAHGEDPGESYMPDMYYSRAYEAYNYNNVHGERDSLLARGINYNGLPVTGSVARGDQGFYHLSDDSIGLAKAQSLRSPLDSVTSAPANMKEAERLYLIQCGICHGPNLDGNGPLWNDGNGPFPAAPRPLNADYAKNLSDGHIFHVITYGKGAMGAYASQLRPEQRWWVIKYIRSKQGGGKAADSTAAAAPQPGAASMQVPAGKVATGSNANDTKK